MSERVHLGAQHYHRDRGGVPACPHLQWRLSDMDVVDREQAERDGYEPCSRCTN